MKCIVAHRLFSIFFSIELQDSKMTKNVHFVIWQFQTLNKAAIVKRFHEGNQFVKWPWPFGQLISIMISYILLNIVALYTIYSAFRSYFHFMLVATFHHSHFLLLENLLTVSKHQNYSVLIIFPNKNYKQNKNQWIICCFKSWSLNGLMI